METVLFLMYMPNLLSLTKNLLPLKRCSVLTIECSNSAQATVCVSVDIVGCFFLIQCTDLWIKYVPSVIRI